jgi:radical SAM superfamily enzyme YgiQ (UPF0313 family)
MRIVLVQPNAGAVRAGDAMEPLALGVLSALTPAGHQVTLVDERVEPVPEALEADLVGLSVQTYTARRAYQLADGFRRRGLRVVMGGHHASLVPDEAAAHADAVVIGDAEGIWPRVVADAGAGTLRSRYRADSAPPLRGVRVDRALFAGKGYLRWPLVQFGRGCRHACDFCSIHALYGGGHRHRPVDETVDEVAALPGRSVFFVDDNLFADPEAALALLAALPATGKRWGAQLSIDALADQGTVDLLAAAGCGAVLLGLESFDPESLREMRKSWNRAGPSYAECVARLRARGIMVYGTFVFGYDHDGPEAIDQALAFAVAQRLFVANFNPLTPTPGTPLYQRLRAEGRLLGDPWWLDPGFRYGSAQFVPAGMTPAQLAEGVYRARRRFYGWRSIAWRALDRQANTRSLASAALYLGANLVSRREIRLKQGRELGGS